MIRTTIIAGGLLGLGIFTAAPAMAAPPVVIDCSPPATCPLITYYTGNGPNTAAGQFTTAWTTGPQTALTTLATGPATALKVWTDALGITTPPVTAPPPPASTG